MDGPKELNPLPCYIAETDMDQNFGVVFRSFEIQISYFLEQFAKVIFVQ